MRQYDDGVTAGRRIDKDLSNINGGFDRLCRSLFPVIPLRRRELLIAGLTLPLAALPGVGMPWPLRALAGEGPLQDQL
ncbi:MAG TPA: hypothetical protein VFS82_00110, partial [Lysobacter sp.]|nr:hypothetical protein [Lysobacter sp.]